MWGLRASWMGLLHVICALAASAKLDREEPHDDELPKVNFPRALVSSGSAHGHIFLPGHFCTPFETPPSPIPARGFPFTQEHTLFTCFRPNEVHQEYLTTHLPASPPWLRWAMSFST